MPRGSAWCATIARPETTCDISFDGQEGDYNEVASLLLSGAEGATKLLGTEKTQKTRTPRDLFSRDQIHLTVGSVALTLFAYFSMAMGVAGLSLPMGGPAF